jgi:hypothetical protein
VFVNNDFEVVGKIPLTMNFPVQTPDKQARIPPATAALFHLLPQSGLDRRIEAGTYDTVETCEDDEEDVQALGLSRRLNAAFISSKTDSTSEHTGAGVLADPTPPDD